MIWFVVILAAIRSCIEGVKRPRLYRFKLRLHLCQACVACWVSRLVRLFIERLLCKVILRWSITTLLLIFFADHWFLVRLGWLFSKLLVVLFLLSLFCLLCLFCWGILLDCRTFIRLLLFLIFFVLLRLNFSYFSWLGLLKISLFIGLYFCRLLNSLLPWLLLPLFLLLQDIA